VFSALCFISLSRDVPAICQRTILRCAGLLHIEILVRLLSRIICLNTFSEGLEHLIDTCRKCLSLADADNSRMNSLSRERWREDVTKWCLLQPAYQPNFAASSLLMTLGLRPETTLPSIEIYRDSNYSTSTPMYIHWSRFKIFNGAKLDLSRSTVTTFPRLSARSGSTLCVKSLAILQDL
jgi:hypothetical protein